MINIKFKVSESNIDILMNSCLYKHRNDINISTDNDIHTLTYPDELGEYVSNCIEVHIGLNGDYSSAATEVMMNKSNDISAAIENVLTEKANEYRYDDMKSVRSYTGFDNPFKEQCITLATWSSLCWVKASEIEIDVMNGARQMPSVEQVLLELPVCPI